MNLFNQSIKKFQAGAALIEFAIIVPLLLLLVVGISEFGYAFYHLNILNKSVQDGARYFSDSAHATNDKVGQSIVVTNANPYYLKTQNLVIYGSIIADTTRPCTTLLPQPPPPNDCVLPGNYAPLPAVNCVGVEGQITLCTATPQPQHIMVTATYNHNLILGSTLYNLCKLISKNNTSCVSQNGTYPLTASSVLRVE